MGQTREQPNPTVHLKLLPPKQITTDVRYYKHSETYKKNDTFTVMFPFLLMKCKTRLNVVDLNIMLSKNF